MSTAKPPCYCLVFVKSLLLRDVDRYGTLDWYGFLPFLPIRLLYSRCQTEKTNKQSACLLTTDRRYDMYNMCCLFRTDKNLKVEEKIEKNLALLMVLIMIIPACTLIIKCCETGCRDRKKFQGGQSACLYWEIMRHQQWKHPILFLYFCRGFSGN